MPPKSAFVVEVRGEWFGAELGFRALGKQMKDARNPLKRGMHKYMKVPVKNRFMAGGIPKWKKRDPLHQYPGPPLRSTGRLMKSVTIPTSTDNKISYPTDQEITLESKVPYAPFHDKNRGNTKPNPKIPGRPFLEMTEKDADIFLDILLKWSVNEARKSFGNPTSKV